MTGDPAESRVCAYCPVPLVRHPGEQNYDYNRRRTCGSPACLKAACQAGAQHTYQMLYEGRPIPKPGDGDGRLCAVSDCDRPMIRKRGERPQAFRLRETCSSACAGRLRADRRLRAEKEQPAQPIVTRPQWPEWARFDDDPRSRAQSSLGRAAPAETIVPTERWF